MSPYQFQHFTGVGALFFHLHNGPVNDAAPGFHVCRCRLHDLNTLLQQCLPGAVMVYYYFEGFLPAKPGQRRARLTELLEHVAAVVLFEAPHRIEAALTDLATLAPERRLMIGREMTKRHETYLCDVPAALLETLRREDQLRGEFVCVLEGNSAPADLDARRMLQILLEELSPARAARVAARLCESSKSELYDLALELTGAAGD